MDIITLTTPELEKLVNLLPPPVLVVPLPKPHRLKGRHKEPAHIRGHLVKGKVYYYYLRGTDREIYLGSADSILKAVKG
jgi:hypothetical protein